jgi:hypothetical protein
VSVEQQQGGSSIDDSLLKSDVLSSETVDSLWTDWTLFEDNALNTGADPLGLNVLPMDNDPSLATISSADLASTSLSAESFGDASLLDISFDLFGLGKDDKNAAAMDIDLFGAIDAAAIKDM